MKNLKLEHPKHIRLEKGFRDWLELTGYAATSVYGMPNSTREFLHYLETEGKPLETLIPPDITAYFFHLGERKKKNRTGLCLASGGALSTSYLHKHLQAIKQFSRYLKETGQGGFEADIILPEQKSKMPETLDKEEIRLLYESCTASPIGLRDRAMLAIFYGCGLRRNEGVSLDIQDILKDKNLLYVRKGKNYQERYVPMASEIKQDLQSYLEYGRGSQEKETRQQAFFLSERGTRISGQSLQLRLKQLAEKAGVTKNASLHALRHSIATHLLQSGMKLQDIARFLGHKSLESTQIYTHIVNDL